MGLKSSPPKANQAKSSSKAYHLGFSREVLQSTSVLTQWSNIEMKPKRRMNKTQIEEKAQREANRIDQFQQRKLIIG